MIEEITVHESEESGVFILQFIEVIVFDIVDYIILDGLIHRPHIAVYSPSFIVIEL